MIFCHDSLIFGSRDMSNRVYLANIAINRPYKLIKTLYIKFSNRCMLVENGHCLWQLTLTINFRLFLIKYVNVLNIVLGNILSTRGCCSVHVLWHVVSTCCRCGACTMLLRQPYSLWRPHAFAMAAAWCTRCVTVAAVAVISQCNWLRHFIIIPC